MILLAYIELRGDRVGRDFRLGWSWYGYDGLQLDVHLIAFPRAEGNGLAGRQEHRQLACIDHESNKINRNCYYGGGLA